MILNFLLTKYKETLSFLLKILFGNGCLFLPTCSEYAVGAIEKHGAIKGSVLGLKRVLRCHPLSNPSFDPVPEKV